MSRGDICCNSALLGIEKSAMARMGATFARIQLDLASKKTALARVGMTFAIIQVRLASEEATLAQRGGNIGSNSSPRRLESGCFRLNFNSKKVGFGKSWIRKGLHLKKVNPNKIGFEKSWIRKSWNMDSKGVDSKSRIRYQLSRVKSGQVESS